MKSPESEFKISGEIVEKPHFARSFTVILALITHHVPYHREVVYYCIVNQNAMQVQRLLLTTIRPLLSYEAVLEMCTLIILHWESECARIHSKAFKSCFYTT